MLAPLPGAPPRRSSTSRSSSATAAPGRDGSSTRAARPSFVSPLRHPSEVSASVRTTDRDKHTDATKVAWWTNMMLHAEEQTRGQRRAYVLYDELLTDWRSALRRAEKA